MRVSLAAAVCGVSIAVLAGCSTSQDVPGVPSSGLSQNHVLYHAPLATGGKLGLWAYIGNDHYLLGLTADGERDVYAIDVSQNGCGSGSGMKVDGSGNAWISCGAYGSSAVGAVQEYRNTGTLVNTYITRCPSNVSQCSNWFASADDVAVDGSGGVYAALPQALACNPGCTNAFGTGWEYFASPSSQPIYANVFGNQPSGCSSNCMDVSYVYYFDVDGSGNVWTNFYGCEEYGSFICGIGIAEVTGVSSGNPTFTVVLAPGVLPGSISFYGRTFYAGISIAGGTATVVDNYNRHVYQYALPITPSSTPSTLGITRQNLQFCGSPLVGGFNASGSTFAVADTCGWIDSLKHRKDHTITNIGLVGVTAAGYAPSNK
jgi:hypothetical protein